VAIPGHSGKSRVTNKKARMQSELEVKEEEGVLMSYVLELLRQLSVLFLQGEEAPTNF
jgi:hypothetical protein